MIGLRLRLLRLAPWVAGVGLTTMLLWWDREALDKAHMALAYLLLVLGGSAREGRFVGIVLSLACFLMFNFFLLPPYHTFKVADPYDWGVLAVFLLTSGVAAQLLHRQQVATRLADLRSREVDRLAILGAESLSVARASDAVEAIIRVIRTELPVPQATIRLVQSDLPSTRAGFPQNGSEEEIDRYVIRENRVVVRRFGLARVEAAGVRVAEALSRASGATDIVIPLRVRDEALGVLRLSDRDGLRLEASQAVFADALVYYAALAAERVRLSAVADRIEALREADRLKDALLASVSHDLRTPLTSIRATANELRAEGEERGALIEEEADRLNRMVSDLLDLSRLRAGALPVRTEVNAAEDLLGAALQRLSGLPGASEIRVSLPEGAAIPLGRFDFVHSLRALTNLIENALRHSPAPGSVQVLVRTEDDQLVFCVADRGAGVREADRPLLFEPFFRSASPSAPRGTGLGLAIASRVAEAQHGAIRYEPRAGGGSVFELRLPSASLDAGP